MAWAPARRDLRRLRARARLVEEARADPLEKVV